MEGQRGPHQRQSCESVRQQQPMLLGKMVLVVTTTLVHLAVLGSGALFGSWRVDDQVTEERSMLCFHVGTLSSAPGEELAGTHIPWLLTSCVICCCFCQIRGYTGESVVHKLDYRCTRESTVLVFLCLHSNFTNDEQVLCLSRPICFTISPRVLHEHLVIGQPRVFSLRVAYYKQYAAEQGVPEYVLPGK